MKRTTRIKKAPALGIAALLSSTLILTDATPAQAAPLLRPEIDLALAYINNGLSPFQTAQSIKGVLEFLGILTPTNQGLELANKLAQTEARLTQEIRFWMLGELDSATDAAFDKYDYILRNPGQNTRTENILLFLTGTSDSIDAGHLYNELERVINDSPDVEQSMQLTVPFNALTVMMAHATVWADRFFSDEPATAWRTFHDRYSATYQANYGLVKVSRIMCYPGYNPELADIVAEHDAVFQTSRLYQKRENRFIAAGTVSCGGATSSISINPVTKQTRHNCRRSINAQSLAAAHERARVSAQSDFRTADDVDALRDIIRNLRFLSGGDYWNGIAGDLNNHEFFDPWVFEPTLCAANGSAAYVQRP